MNIPILPAKTSINGKRIFLRIDWNVPLGKDLAPDDSLKVSRSITTIRELSARGAVVILATHLGRPDGRDLKFTTRPLGEMVAAQYHVPIDFVDAALDTKAGLAAAQQAVGAAEPGTVMLLENVRFYAGEEKNASALAKAYASLADLFVNDAFASCHRAHASVVGVAKLLPRYAGPNLVDEVTALSRLIGKPKKPMVAIVGGAKISTKIDVIETLAEIADRVFIGGAMANAFFAAQKMNIGGSYVEKEGIALAKKILKNKKIVLPVDAVVAKKLRDGAAARSASVDGVKTTECIGDIGPQTMLAWSQEIKKANTIVWNGPLGVTEIPTFAHGSQVIAHAIAERSRGAAYGVVGGGDTLPVVLKTGMSGGIDHLSTGGGAMLEFIATRGKLPGLSALAATGKK